MILDSGENCVCVSFVAFSVDFSQLLSQSCTSAVCPRSFLCAWCQKLHCRGLVVLMTLDGSVMVCIFCDFSRIFLFFFRGGSNMVAFRAKVDGTWQAKFQRRLRYRVAGLRPSGLPNLPFSLSLPFPPSSSNSFPFPNVFSNFFLFSPFSLLPSFFFPFFFHSLPVIFHHFLQFHAFSRVFWSKRRVSM